MPREREKGGREEMNGKGVEGEEWRRKGRSGQRVSGVGRGEGREPQSFD